MRVSIVLWCVWSASILFSQNAYFTTDPCLTPDGKSIIFSHEDDLWMVSSDGGNAVRLTGMDGRETNPRVSPDGQWLAFTGNQDGNANIYVMPMKGGDIKQLTFYDLNDLVDSWSWDSKYIYFTSSRYNNFAAYKVSVSGETPIRLFDNYFNTPHHVVEHPTTGEYYFTETWESTFQAPRKRYKGAHNPDIETYNPKTGEFKVLTTYEGKDFWPTIDRNGGVFFVSDEENGEYNLYTFTAGKKQALTKFTTSIQRPNVSANGEKVVFEKDYQLHIYDVKTKSTQKVSIQLPRNNKLVLTQSLNTAGNITNFDVSPDKKKIAFIARGVLFVADIKGQFIREIPTRTKERVTEVLWGDDNNTLIYVQTVNGWQNLFTITADGKTTEQVLTNEQRNNRSLNMSKSRDKIVYLSGIDELRLLDLKSKKNETLVKDEFWAIQNANPYFSPDEKYLVYSPYRNFEHEIFIYDLQKRTAVNITNSGVTETNPYWSPDGKYLYFSSNRLKPRYPFGTQSSKIYRIPLEKFDDVFKSDKYDELFAKQEKADDKKDDKKPSVVVAIDFKDMMDRIEQVSPNAGTQDVPVVYTKDADAVVLYISDHDGGNQFIWKTLYKPFEAPKTEKIKNTGSNNLGIYSCDNKPYALIDGNVFEINLETNDVSKVNLSAAFERTFSDEFSQMFYEAWASVNENFYDEHYHGIDWNAMKKRYEAFLPYLASRANLRTILNDMLGELNASHTAFFSNGTEEKTFYAMKTAASGIMFKENDPYVVDRIVEGSPADMKGKNILPGDRLVSINGISVDSKTNRERYFVSPKQDEELVLTFQRGSVANTVKIHPVTSGAFKTLLYDEWISRNRKAVDQLSQNKIGYVHMKNMSQASFDQFMVEMTTKAFEKDGLIVDLRYNTGGNVHDEVLNFLSQRAYMKWKYREGKFTPQPSFSPSDQPIVLLVNDQSLSDAELTANGFQYLKLGKVIGTETYRWIIYTSGTFLVDGSFCRLPSWGCYTLDGKNIEKSGIVPDIVVKTTLKDRVEGKDPQIETAVNEILKGIKK
ncbi:PDZ domain-containing protein [bacterium]|nr:PDZ domain-containing protein [bacterium]